MWTSLAAIVSTAREDGRLAPPPAQHKTLGRWVGLMLKGDAAAVAGAQQEANSIAAAGEESQALAVLADGVGLCRLVQRLSRRPLTFSDAPASTLTLADKLANVNAAMAAMEDEGIRCRGYKAADVVEGKPTALAEIVWQLMLHYHCRWRPSPEELAALASPREGRARSTSLGEGTAPMSPQQRTKLSFEWSLLVWIRSLVPKELNAKDLSYETWQDGKAMCFLVNKLCGEGSPIDMQQVMNCVDGEENLRRAFAAASDKLNIPRLLDEEDFFLEKAKTAQNLIDERSLVAYITYFKNHHDNVPLDSASPSVEEREPSPRRKPRIKRLDFRSLGSRRRTTSAVHVSIEKDQTITDLKQFLRPGAVGQPRVGSDQEQDDNSSSSSDSEDDNEAVQLELTIEQLKKELNDLRRELAEKEHAILAMKASDELRTKESDLAMARFVTEHSREVERMAVEKATLEELGHQRKREAEELVALAQRSVGEKEKQLADVRDELRTLHDKHVQASMRVQELDQAAATLQEQLSTVRAQLEESDRKRQVTERELQAATSTLPEVAASLATVARSSADLGRTLGEKEVVILRLLDEKRIIEAERDKERADHARLHKEKDVRLEDECRRADTAEATVITLRGQLSELEAQAEVHCRVLREAEEKLLTNDEQLRQAIVAREEREIALSHAVIKIEHLTGELADERAHAKAAKEELSKREAEHAEAIRLAEQRLDQECRKLETTEQEVIAQKLRADAMEAEMKHLQRSMESLASMKSQEDRQMMLDLESRWTSRVDELAQRTECAQKDAEEERARLETRTKELEQLRAEAEHDKREAEERERELRKRLEEEAEIVRREIATRDALLGELEGLKVVNACLGEEKQRQDAHMRVLQERAERQLEDGEAKRRELKLECEGHLNEAKRLTEKTTALEADLASVRTQQEQRETEMARLQAERAERLDHGYALKEVEEEWRTRLETVQGEVNRLRGENDVLASQLAANAIEREQLRAEVGELERRVQASNERSQDERKAAEQERQRLAHESEAIASESARLAEKVFAAEEEAERLRVELDAKTDEVIQAQKRNAELQSQCDNKTSDLELKEDQLTRLRSENEASASELEQTRAQLVRLRQERTKLESDAQTATERLKQQAQAHDRERDTLARESEEERQRLHAELKRRDAEFEELRSRMDELEQQLHAKGQATAAEEERGKLKDERIAEAERMLEELRGELKQKDVQLTAAIGRATASESREKEQRKAATEREEELVRKAAAERVEADRWRLKSEELKAESERADERRRRLEERLRSARADTDRLQRAQDEKEELEVVAGATSTVREEVGEEEKRLRDQVCEMQEREKSMKVLLMESEEDIDKLEEELIEVKRRRDDLRSERDSLSTLVEQLRREREDEARKLKLAALEARRRDDEIQRLRAQRREADRRMTDELQSLRQSQQQAHPEPPAVESYGDGDDEQQRQRHAGSEGYVGAIDVRSRPHSPMSSRRVALDGEAAASPPRGIAKQMSERFEKMSTKPRASPPSSPSTPGYSSRTLPRSAFSSYRTALQEHEASAAASQANGDAATAPAQPVKSENGSDSDGGGSGEGLRSWARMRRVDYKAVAAQRKGSSASPSDSSTSPSSPHAPPTSPPAE